MDTAFRGLFLLDLYLAYSTMDYANVVEDYLALNMLVDVNFHIAMQVAPTESLPAPDARNKGDSCASKFSNVCCPASSGT
jgi:hypothetical protein